ncbi:MAG: nucleoside deaminase [Zoogloeaceae bacterium]|nr:nucleoside deaminase [Rhodocyclaceae bacterium]MCP5234862.1 nucleoside deaminase [Zoogloeaceae bacterium]
MAFVIQAARQNVRECSGGPFAAAVFEQGSGALVSLGINLVTTEQLSMLHAEMVAIAFAQRTLGRRDLGRVGHPALEIVTSVEPCAMCFGAIPWSGLTKVISGASDADAREIGFDEGPKPEDWTRPLIERGIDVRTEVMRAEAKAVLDEYARAGGIIYNPCDRE